MKVQGYHTNACPAAFCLEAGGDANELFVSMRLPAVLLATFMRNAWHNGAATRGISELATCATSASQ